ncbi:hypothetical protein SAMD00019534_064500 [Acytostelium subglobosum LB1]|uniref:hypothetical protein n=1 Tax=Acytostelium subglobosum LB1 TaxID=1410327 RepID=UPI0006448A6C|nr:hypothetical protein SAMD00019534_064500 [Acytostelium subglobosum LB1]GAM23275.1 hypothetical protein SAMD00019534_064500 [Acytostelium subglobosum LB1]|eukprot:XP_012753724.1 hypothetical protein SAMD00019534_064500 [Acytostelium subglobosum LB1]
MSSKLASSKLHTYPKVGIFWNIEEAPIPPIMTLPAVLSQLKMYAMSFGILKTITVVSDSMTPHNLTKIEWNQQGVHFIEVPCSSNTGQPTGLDRMEMVSKIWEFVYDNHDTSINVILIDRKANEYTISKALQQRGVHMVTLVSPCHVNYISPDTFYPQEDTSSSPPSSSSPIHQTFNYDYKEVRPDIRSSYENINDIGSNNDYVHNHPRPKLIMSSSQPNIHIPHLHQTLYMNCSSESLSSRSTRSSPLLSGGSTPMNTPTQSGSPVMHMGISPIPTHPLSGPTSSTSHRLGSPADSLSLLPMPNSPRTNTSSSPSLLKSPGRSPAATVSSAGASTYSQSPPHFDNSVLRNLYTVIQGLKEDGFRPTFKVILPRLGNLMGLRIHRSHFEKILDKAKSNNFQVDYSTKTIYFKDDIYGGADPHRAKKSHFAEEVIGELLQLVERAPTKVFPSRFSIVLWLTSQNTPHINSLKQGQIVELCQVAINENYLSLSEVQKKSERRSKNSVSAGFPKE